LIPDFYELAADAFRTIAETVKRLYAFEFATLGRDFSRM
jgi:hypothetical protein